MRFMIVVYLHVCDNSSIAASLFIELPPLLVQCEQLFVVIALRSNAGPPSAWSSICPVVMSLGGRDNNYLALIVSLISLSC